MKAEVQKFEISKETVKEQILDSMTNCCLCGTKLEFFHKTDYATMSVREDSRCPACGIRNKTNTHHLQ